ncbi:MAG: hypothetical protein WKF84_01535 [Pyrinomonadaceae bacterium]
MAITQEEAVKRARVDLASRLGVPETDIKEESVEAADFPDMSLGAPVDDEMSGQMISSGWRIRLQSGSDVHEYRADRNQIRLYDFKGDNFRL